MITFGFLTLNNKLEHSYFTEVAKRGCLHSVNVYCFSPNDIDPKTELVHGKKYDANKKGWIDDVYPIPTYLYDRCFYSTEDVRKKSAPIVNWLKNRADIGFIGHGLPNKWSIYNMLSSHPLLKYYIPLTVKVMSTNDIFKMLYKHKNILLKPENGSQGRGIITLSLKNNQIELQTQRHKKAITKIFSKKEELADWLKKLISSHHYLAQPFLSLQDNENKPFDIRILVQKNFENKWIEVGRGVRKGQIGHHISNLHGGGAVHSYEEWLQTIHDAHQKVLIDDDIDTIITKLPFVLEQSFGPLFEIGIDIGIAKDGTIWVLDTNSKPGHKTIKETNQGIENHLYEAPILYCKHLALQRS